MTLPGRHKPTSLRPTLPPPREVAYGIGECEVGDKYGMWAGPTPNLQEMLDTVGESAYSRIVRFNSDNTDTVLYAWRDDSNEWVYIGPAEAEV